MTHRAAVRRRVGWWLPGLVVAVGAAAATAHGLYEVAAAARVPPGVAWIYPLITDGLAVVAYTATARLQGSPRRYAWAVVVLSAGLSGLAQAVFLAGDPTGPAGSDAIVGAGVGFEVPAALRFGVGAWPAIAAALAAHLLHLLALADRGPGPGDGREPVEAVTAATTANPAGRSTGGVQAAAYNGSAVQVDALTAAPPVQDAGVQPRPVPSLDGSPAAPSGDPVGQSPARGGEAPARERARAAAARLLARDGALPTVSALGAEARVSRGTAATVLKTLRAATGPPAPAPPTATTAAFEEPQP